jgi:threonine dehydrogenase-like Zn-dependent dehydrogenase
MAAPGPPLLTRTLCAPQSGTASPSQVSVKTVPKPQLLASEDAVVRLTSASICGSDLHIYHGVFVSSNPGWVLGHEGVGIVQEVGEAVQNVKPGDRVIVSAIIDDGVLKLQDVPSSMTFGCGKEIGVGDHEGMQGKHHVSLLHLLLMYWPMLLAEYVRVPQADTTLIPIPHYPSHELTYLFVSDAWATAWTCLDFSGFRAGETVAVFGAGLIGLLCAYTALFRGAAKVYIVDHVKARLAKGKEIGAIPIDFTEGNAADQILKFEKLDVDRSCDYVGYECLNAELKPQQNYVINDLVSVTIAAGGIGQTGVYLAQAAAPGRPEAAKFSPMIEFPQTAFWSKSLTLKAGIVDPQALAPQLVQLIKNRRVDLSWVVSSVIAIEDVPEGYQRFDKALDTKVVIRFKWEEDEWDVGNGSGHGHEKENGNGHHRDMARKTRWESLEGAEGEF